MKIDLIAPPFSGHLHPILAMANGLAGEFDVRVVSTAGVQQRIVDAGLVAVSILSEADEAQLRALTDPPYAVGNNPLLLHRQFSGTLLLMASLRSALLALYASDRPDLLIADFVLAPVGAVAAQLDIAWWTSLPSPCVVETVDGPPAYLGGLRPAATWGGRLREALARRFVRSFKRVVHGSHRRALARAGVPTLYRDDGSEAAYSPDRILALGLEELEFARRWPAAVRFVGPQPYSSSRPGAAPAFVAGRRHVLVTSGTHLRWFKEAFAQAALRTAAAMPDVVFHFSDGDASSSSPPWTRGNFTRHPYIDYGTCLQRYDLVIHHGGAGVLYECLRCGKPAIVFPVDYDQFDHAARLEARGVAVWLRRLTGLEAAVRDVLSATHMAAAAAAMRRRIEDVVAEQRVVRLVRAFGAGR